MNLNIRLFQKSDLPGLKNWGVHKDIRFLHYDFNGFSDSDYLSWYRRKQGLYFRKLFVVLDNDRLIGFITLKQRNPINKTAYIGIVFDPHCLGKGYGPQALKVFTEMIFKQYAVNKLLLKVASFNQRAIKCYDKVGFKTVSMQIEPFEEQNYSFELLCSEPDFHMKGSVLMAKVYTMQISSCSI